MQTDRAEAALQERGALEDRIRLLEVRVEGGGGCVVAEVGTACALNAEVRLEGKETHFGREPHWKTEP